jgi:hypothetical protein
MNPGTSTAIHAHGLSKDYGAGNGLFDLLVAAVFTIRRRDLRG